jgi:hypothetical protein
MQATTDPREIIPYSRASALIPGTTVSKPTASPSVKKIVGYSINLVLVDFQ